MAALSPQRIARRRCPALVVAGAGLGRFKWIVPATDGPTTPTSRKRGRIAQGNGNGNGHECVPYERKAEEKKAPYDKRRRQIVIDAVKAKLEALAAEDDRLKLTDLEGGEALAGRGLLAKALCFLGAMLDERGWRDNVHQGSFRLPDGTDWNDLARLKNHELGQGELRETLLDLSLNLLRLAIGRYGVRLLVAPGERDNEAQYADTETICGLLGFDLVQLRAQAAEAIPYAKCWRDEVEDDWIVSNGTESNKEENA